MNINELKQLLTKLELKDLEKEHSLKLRSIGELMIEQGQALKSIAEINFLKKRMSPSFEEERKATKSTEA